MNNYSNSKKLFIAIIICFIILVILISIYIRQDHSFDTLKDLPQINPSKQKSTNIKIGIIGDSWVFGQKLDQSIYNNIKKMGLEVEVFSSGHPGAKTRQIYRNLIADKSIPFSSNSLLHKNLNYIIVVAGVNDTAGHIGKDYYAHHMILIIKTILASGACPVILEIPEYGIKETKADNFLSFSKRIIYQALFDNMQKNVIADYREELRKSIPSSIKDKIIFIPFDGFIEDYSKNQHLYYDSAHLNKIGQEQLGAYIAQKIIIKN